MREMLMNEKVRIGIDVGSTTAKIVVLSEDNSVIYSEYTRHNADVKNTILGFFTRLRGQLADARLEVDAHQVGHHQRPQQLRPLKPHQLPQSSRRQRPLRRSQRKAISRSTGRSSHSSSRRTYRQRRARR